MDSNHNRSVEKLVVVAVVTIRNEKGELLEEKTADPIPLYRGSTPDVWAWADAQLAKP